MPGVNPYKSYDMNPDKERDGVVVVENEHFRITGRRAGGKNVKFESVRDFKTKPHRRAIATGTLDKGTQDRLNAELAAETLVALWETNQSEDGGKTPKWVPNTIHDVESGEIVPYTEEVAVKTFLRYDELYEQFSRGCGDIENFLDKDQTEADVGN